MSRYRGHAWLISYARPVPNDTNPTLTIPAANPIPQMVTIRVGG